MTGKVHTPKFLTAGLATQVLSEVAEFMTKSDSHLHTAALLSRPMFHIVLFVPQVNGEGWNTLSKPFMLAEHSEGERGNWPYPFAEIAYSKALQCWHERNDDRTDIMPHLLVSGEAPFWGAVKRQGIVVACSGVQPYFDKMIAGIVADMVIARAYHAWITSEDKTCTDGEACFLA